MRGGGTPSAWHINRAVPALGRVWLSGLSTMDGGTETEVQEKSDENAVYLTHKTQIVWHLVPEFTSAKAFVVLWHMEYKKQ